MNLPANLDALSPDELRTLAAQLMAEVGEKNRELRYRQTRIDQLTHEIAALKRLQYGKRSEQFTTGQMSLLDEAIGGDLAALEIELEQLQPTPADKQRQKPRRAPLPLHFPHTDIHHEPDDITCACGCQRVRVGEDISEKLDYTPGVFTLERHIRGKWACKTCETLVQAPVPPHVIDKGIPTAGLLAQVLVAKYGDHLPLYRQERIFERAGLAIPQSTLGECLSGACMASSSDKRKSGAFLGCSVSAHKSLSGAQSSVTKKLCATGSDTRGPRLKKAQREGRLIVFIDETGISERPTRVRTWAPKGQTPVIQFHFNWNHVSAIAGLSRTNYLFRLYEGSVKKEQVVEFLKALKAHLKQPLLIIWDGARPHHAAIVRQYLDSLEGHIQITFLPPYCPELNPVEYLWAWLKRHAIANFCPDNLDELHTVARNKLKNAQHRPSIIAACWIQVTLW